MQKVSVDNHNPVKTSHINKPGATPQNFCEVCVIAEPKKLTHRPAKIPLRKHANLEKGQKFGLFFVFTCKNLIHATFLSLTFIFHKIPVLVEFPAPWQLSKVKS